VTEAAFFTRWNLSPSSVPDGVRSVRGLPLCHRRDRHRDLQDEVGEHATREPRRRHCQSGAQRRELIRIKGPASRLAFVCVHDRHFHNSIEFPVANLDGPLLPRFSQKLRLGLHRRRALWCIRPPEPAARAGAATVIAIDINPKAAETARPSPGNSWRPERSNSAIAALLPLTPRAQLKKRLPSTKSLTRSIRSG
jgi:hypothetical protein